MHPDPRSGVGFLREHGPHAPQRGLLEAGAFADVVLLDPTRVADRAPALVHDLPGGGPRLVARADGIEMVIVNGAVAVERGELTGARPGRVLRGA